MTYVAALRDHLEREILSQVPGTWVNGAGSQRVANTSNIGFSGIDGDDLVGVLNGMDIAVSNGSACHSKSLAPSHVLTAMTGSRQLAGQSIRFSLSHLNTTEEVEYILKSMKSALAKLG
jgi:cysteine desulfurase